MLRKITQAIGRYGEGETKDYPKGVWDKIAADLMKDPKNAGVFAGTKGDVQKGLAAFSTPIDINQNLQSALRGPIKTRQRPGSPARIPARGARA